MCISFTDQELDETAKELRTRIHEFLAKKSRHACTLGFFGHRRSGDQGGGNVVALASSSAHLLLLFGGF
jgi:hypothetical protein